MKIKEIERLIRRAIQSSEMKSAHFEDADTTERIKDTTRLYRESWIINPLKQALELIEEGTPKRK